MNYRKSILVLTFIASTILACNNNNVLRGNENNIPKVKSSDKIELNEKDLDAEENASFYSKMLKIGKSINNTANSAYETSKTVAKSINNGANSVYKTSKKVVEECGNVLSYAEVPGVVIGSVIGKTGSFVSTAGDCIFAAANSKKAEEVSENMAICLYDGCNYLGDKTGFKNTFEVIGNTLYYPTKYVPRNLLLGTGYLVDFLGRPVKLIGDGIKHAGKKSRELRIDRAKEKENNNNLELV